MKSDQFHNMSSRVVREGFEDLAAEVFPGAFELYGPIKEV
jgi:hypothetical protein